MVHPVELAAEDAPELVALYADHDWWADRDVDRVATAVEGSDLALGLRDGDDLVAAARVLTDGAYYATAHDVIVAAGRRGEGLGERLMHAVVEHDALGDAPRVSLSCREGLTGFYEDCGFEPALETVEHDGGTERLVSVVYHR
ncbi:MAG: GNAT family N-acetyltransferase [Halobacterium sp.]